jgi:hypothetical protein
MASMREIMGLGVVLGLVGIALFALSHRRYPTVWPPSILRPVLLSVGVVSVVATGFQVAGLIGAALPFALAIYSSFRTHDFLVLFGRSGPRATVQDALDRIGVEYAIHGQVVRIERPPADITLRTLPFRSTWVSITAAAQTPKLTLIERLLHKLFANQTAQEEKRVQG